MNFRFYLIFIGGLLGFSLTFYKILKKSKNKKNTIIEIFLGICAIEFCHQVANYIQSL